MSKHQPLPNDKATLEEWEQYNPPNWINSIVKRMAIAKLKKGTEKDNIKDTETLVEYYKRVGIKYSLNEKSNGETTIMMSSKRKVFEEEKVDDTVETMIHNLNRKKYKSKNNKLKKITKWVLAFLAFNIFFAISSYICELYLGWVLKLSGIKFVLIIIYLPITYFFMSLIMLISSAISPYKFWAYSLIRWYCFVCLLFGVIYFFVRKDSFTLLETNNLICLAICMFRKSEVIFD